MNDVYDFEILELWKKTRELRKEISELTQKFPEFEKTELTRQIRRSSRSVTATIAEGNGRFSYADNLRFIRMSNGSLKETMDHLYVAYDEAYIDQDELNCFHGKYQHCRKLMNGYIAYLKSQIKTKTKVLGG